MSKTILKIPFIAIPAISFLGVALAIGVAGCNKSSTPDQAATPAGSAAGTADATQVADDTQDPAMQANLAPAVATTQSAPASSSSSSASQETAPPPPPDQSSDQKDHRQ